mmetsp:Transcript_23999/g.66690  ORF Transcript_23999/g.66690 Transcript_23999/m.66690 type:complete len:297 (+) Transcript_23999:1331-2221(+)
MEGGVVTLQLAEAVLDVAQRCRTHRSRRSRLVGAQQSWHEAAGIQSVGGVDPAVHRLSWHCRQQHRRKLVHQFQGSIGPPEHAQRPLHLPALHEVLNDSLAVLVHRSKVHELVQAAVARQQARGRCVVKHILVLCQKLAQLLYQRLALGAGLPLVVQQSPVDLVELQLCQPGGHHGCLCAVVAGQRLKLAAEELVQGRGVADLDKAQGGLLKGWLWGVEPCKEARRLLEVPRDKGCLRLLHLHGIALLGGEAVSRCLLVIAPGQVDLPHVPPFVTDANLVQCFPRVHEHCLTCGVH